MKDLSGATVTGTSEQAPAPAVIRLHKEATELTAMLRSALATLIEQAAEDGIEVRVHEWPVPELELDRDKIAWAVTALVGNALRYVRHGDKHELGGCVLVHVYQQEPGEIWIAIHDDGPGIPEHKWPHLFTRASGAGHSVGLALSLVKEVVEAHGGRIVVESRRGSDHGTSISLVLPGDVLPARPTATRRPG